MPRPQAALNRHRAIYDGHDAGHYSLPDEVTLARSGFLSVIEADRRSRGHAAPYDEREIERRALDAVFAAAEAGEPIFDPDTPPGWTVELLRSKEEQAQREAESRVLRQAAELAADRLETTLVDMADLTITEHLRPALTEIETAVLTLMPKAAVIPWDQPERVISMGEAQRRVWDDVTRLSVRYRALRAAQEALWRLTETADRGMWRFLEMRNMHAVWPVAGSWMQG